MNCNYGEQKIIDLVYGELSEPEQREMENHLAGCGECRALSEEYAAIRQLTGELEEPVPTRITVNRIMAQARDSAAPNPAGRLGSWLKTLATLCVMGVVGGLVIYQIHSGLISPEGTAPSRSETAAFSKKVPVPPEKKEPAAERPATVRTEAPESKPSGVLPAKDGKTLPTAAKKPRPKPVLRGRNLQERSPEPAAAAPAPPAPPSSPNLKAGLSERLDSSDVGTVKPGGDTQVVNTPKGVDGLTPDVLPIMPKTAGAGKERTSVVTGDLKPDRKPEKMKVRPVRIKAENIATFRASPLGPAQTKALIGKPPQVPTLNGKNGAAGPSDKEQGLHWLHDDTVTDGNGISAPERVNEGLKEGVQTNEVFRTLNKGREDMNSGRYEDARKVFQSLLDHMSPQHEDRPVVLFWLAKAYEGRGHRDKAIEIYQTVARDFPNYKDLAQNKVNELRSK